MSVARRPFLSLFFCLALAVNLLAPFAFASPLFVEICSGHEVLVLAEDAPDPGYCETCTVCCTTLPPPRPWVAGALDVRVIVPGTTPQTYHSAPSFIRPKARAPPSLPV